MARTIEIKEDKGIDLKTMALMSMMNGNNGNGENGGMFNNPMMMMMLLDKDKGFDGAFEAMKPRKISGGLAFTGELVLNGTAIKLDKETGRVELINTEGLDIEFPLYTFPKQISTLEVGDIVLVGKDYIAIQKVDTTANTISGVNVKTGTIATRKIKRSALGFDVLPTVMNMANNMCGIDPMMLALMGE